ncbi:MAG: PCP reductase family protein [Candidatus Rokubacteria bacterium]|nr:PCP reductase family protein [Candidatus Rokubacteria bacterium]
MADDGTIRSILVPVDGSAYSGWAAEVALALAADFGAGITGIHVYTARLHERRFRDMEPGLHADEDLDIGGNAAPLLRFAPCHVLLAARTLEPLGPRAAGEVPDALPWTEEAVARLERVPEFVRGMVRRAVEAHARRRGLPAVDARAVEETRATLRG